MPQLMPFFWFNSIYMVLFLLLTLVILYYYKINEILFLCKKYNEGCSMIFQIKW